MIYPVFLTLIYAAIYKLGGTALLVSLHGLIPAAWIVIWQRFVKSEWDTVSLIVFFVAYVGSSLVFVPRPALVATLPLLIGYVMIIQRQNRPLLPADFCKYLFLEICWVNIHGSFLILPIMLGWEMAFLILNRNFGLIKSRIINLAAVIAALFINPQGWQVLPYTFETASVSYARGLDEWFPPSRFDYPSPSWFFYIFSALLAAWMLRKVKSWAEALKLFTDPFFVLWLSGFFAIRNTFLVFLVLPVFFFNKVMIGGAGKAVYKTLALSGAINRSIVTLLILAAIALSPFFKEKLRDQLPAKYRPVYDPDSYPPAALAYLKNHSGNIFNSWQFGSELPLSQKNKHLIDTRNIIFTDGTLALYENFIADPEKAFSSISKFDFKFFLIHEKHKRILGWLARNGDFKLVVSDPPAYLYEKQN
jgi:hypothetical protein